MGTGASVMCFGLFGFFCFDFDELTLRFERLLLLLYFFFSLCFLVWSRLEDTSMTE